jgi:uncharacterized protein
MKSNEPNALINETSPYLLQHAYNPVNWLAWNAESLARAKEEDKPILVSIGYSACHWCHVMEHESFEDSTVAAIMNENFICIKVDREERPDVDQVYMDAVQLMTGSGGWPLNCFALPTGEPFFGGTYFPKDKWVQVLKQLSDLWKNDREKVLEYSAKLTDGLNKMDEKPLVSTPPEFNSEVLETGVSRWKQSFDLKEGGMDRSPKFPMPNNYDFLLRYGFLTKDKDITDFVHLTLEKMAMGGIYDQIGGGFSRYSTDALWKAPHFEKMLYDNGQLISLYSQAYLHQPNPLYLEVINETAEWVEREMTAKNGAFYSALDADSEGEEGKFYVWKREEIEQIAGEDFDLIADYYSIDNQGLWEHGNYILLRRKSDERISKKHEIEIPTLHEKIAAFKTASMAVRENRIRPGLDDKTLTSWNALMSKGLIDAYVVTKNERWLKLAAQNLDFLTNQQMTSGGKLWHNFKGDKSNINAYLEDYALLIDALIRYYEVTLDESTLPKVKKLIEFVFREFEQSPSGMFYFKSKLDPELVSKKAEITDNVIPASNSVMATNLYKLGLILEDNDLIALSKTQLAQVESSFAQYPGGYSQWMMLHMMISQPYFEVAIVGEDCLKKLQEIQASYLPNVVFCGGKNEGSTPILEHKLVDGKTLYYVCQFGACKTPVESTSEALSQLR